VNPLRRFIRHAELYGCQFVYEAAVDAGVVELDALARRLATLDRNWRIPELPTNGESAAANPHPKAAQRYGYGDSQPTGPPPRPRRQIGTVCQGCGEIFTAARSDASWCSASCRQKAYRQRKKAT
jgi:hypothetical protein